jgi:sugar lactone lactonase YvrE/acetyl esterase/lipase
MKPLIYSLLIPFIAFAQEPKPGLTTLSSEFITSLEARPSQTFASYGGRELQLDLYRPRNISSPLPAIICIHGGGWSKGDRGSMTHLAQALSSRGFVTATISYRLSGEIKFPAQIHDCKAAVRFLRANAAKFGIQSDALGVTGLSAGGHLAALLATSGGVKELEGDGGHSEHSSVVQACIAMGAQSDLESERIKALSRRPDDPHYRPFLGGNAISIPQTYALASPRHHLDKSDPPLAFMTGDQDHESTHAPEMRRDLMKLGIPTGLTVIPNAPHAFLGGQRAFDICVEACDAFFTLHLKQRGRPPFESDLIHAEDWQMLGGGYAGCEGAQWIGDTLHFAAHHDRLAFQWSEKDGLRVWRDDSPEATSFRPDGQGGFYVVEQTTRQLTRWNANGERVEVLADAFEGKKLNRPNDCVVKSDGTVWFTDPDFLFKQRPEDKKELPGQFVFRLDPKTKTIAIVADGLDKPNGIAFSADEEHIFITDSGTEHVFRFAVSAEGTLGEREVFASFAEKGLDGIAFDPQGRLWVCTIDCIRMIGSDGKALGYLNTPSKPTSIAFGPEGRLCVTTRDGCYITRIR